MTHVTESKLLSKAPIVEAIIDLRLITANPVDLAKLEIFCNHFANQFPVRKKSYAFSANFSFKYGQIEPGNSAQHNPLGFRLESSDGKRVLQVTGVSFTFSWLAPYESWEALRDYVKPLWEKYVEVLAPEAVTRTALRYINRIEIPLPINDFDEYLSAPPHVPAKLPQFVDSFLTRVVIPDPAQSAYVIIMQASENVLPEPNCLPIVIDIDAFKEFSVEPLSNSIWETLEQLRNIKNKAFFGSITSKTEELYK